MALIDNIIKVEKTIQSGIDTTQPDQDGNREAQPSGKGAPGVSTAIDFINSHSQQLQQGDKGVLQEGKHDSRRTVDDFETWYGNNAGLTPLQAVTRYEALLAENGQKPLDFISYWPTLRQYDLGKSREENEKLERRRKNQEKYERIGNVLQHLGNFIGTLVGAPSQAIEPMQELTERQRKLYDYTIQQRRQDANDYMKLYYNSIADKRKDEMQQFNMRIQQQKLENEQELDRLRGELLKAQTAGQQERANQLKADIAVKEEQANRIRKLLPYEEQEKKASITQKKASAASSYASAYRSNKAGDATVRNSNIYKEHARNMEEYPADAAEFMKQHNIQTADNKDWTESQIKQFNAAIERKRNKGADSGKTLGIGLGKTKK